MLTKAEAQAFEQGYDARCLGTDVNPFPVTDERHVAWQSGYSAAADECA